MVIGPTPPGTGVIEPATLAQEAKSQSPTSLALPSRSMRLMPTSMTQAPGLIQSPFTISGPADRGDDEVGAAHDGGQVLGARMSDGDGAVLLQQELRHRLADDIGAADDHRLEPVELAERILGEHDGADRRAGDK